jgi:hypothetical protein
MTGNHDAAAIRLRTSLGIIFSLTFLRSPVLDRDDHIVKPVNVLATIGCNDDGGNKSVRFTCVFPVHFAQ